MVCGVGGNVEGSGLDAHDLGCERGWFFGGAEELLSLGALGVLHFMVVEETDRGEQPDDPVSVVLKGRVRCPAGFGNT